MVQTMNKIVYETYKNGAFVPVTLTDADLDSGSVKMFQSNAMVAETLEVDTITFTILDSSHLRRSRLNDVNSVPLNDVNGVPLYAADAASVYDLARYKYGSPIYYYRDNVLEGKFFTRSTSHLGENKYQIEGVSAIGLLAKQKHKGGVYSVTPARDIIAEIMQDVPYSISSDVASVMLNGWLPYTNDARANLHQVLFALGASIAKDENKDLNIVFLGSNVATQIDEDRIYQDGQINYLSQVTEVQVLEHTYHELEQDETKTLFDNTNGSGVADHYELVFDVPCHNLQVSGSLELLESGANYAIVSGVGVLTGQAYTHTTRVVSSLTGIDAEPNLIRVEDMTLVTELNSPNVVQRLQNYYSQVIEAVTSIALRQNDVMPTDKISFLDAYGRQQTGYVKNTEKYVSGTTKVTAHVTTDWEPGPFGSNYKNYVVLTGSGSWAIPSGATRIRVVLGAGGNGSKGGQAGQRGPYLVDTFGGQKINYPDHYSEGGNGTEGADPGKVFVFDVENPSGLLTYNCGNAGSKGIGGATAYAEGTDGTEGGPTTATISGQLYSSDLGQIPAFGYTNVFTGDTYSTKGENGIPGGKGGAPSTGDNILPGLPGEDVANWRGGSPGQYYSGANSSWQYGGSGGGAAYGADGGDGEDGHVYYHDRPGSQAGYMDKDGGHGGQGGNAIPNPENVPLGGGGHGANGGGGAGQDGIAKLKDLYWDTYDYEDFGSNRFGHGSDGRDGGAGYVVVYY